MKSALTLDSNRLVSEQERDTATSLFREHGALWLRNVIDRQFVGQLADAFDHQYASLATSTLRKRFALVGDRRFMISLKLKRPFRDASLYANQRWFPIIQNLLGANCTLSSFGAVVAFARADAQPAHFDYPPLFESEELCGSLPPHAVTVVVPLRDLDERTGTTAIWEGSHRQAGTRDLLERLVEEPSLEGASLPMAQAGDAYLMDYRLLHAGMANQSDRHRTILYMVYRRPWFHESWNFGEQPAVRISPKQLAKIPAEWQHLFAEHVATR